MCDYCSDLRYVEPAHYLSIRDDNGVLDDWLQEARNEKKYIHFIYKDGQLYAFDVIEQCPTCGYRFTEKD